MIENIDVIDDFERSLLLINRIKAKKYFNELNRTWSALQLVENLIVPVLYRIGEKWEKGKIALSQVYMSGRICEELVEKILPSNTYIRKDQPKMAIAVFEDYHNLGKRIVINVLRASGFNIIDYGHGVQVDDLVHKVPNDNIEILLISTLMLPSALHIKNLREELDENGIFVKIIVGGAPFLFDDQLWKAIGADAMCHNASEVVGVIKGIIGGKSSE